MGELVKKRVGTKTTAEKTTAELNWQSGQGTAEIKPTLPPVSTQVNAVASMPQGLPKQPSEGLPTPGASSSGGVRSRKARPQSHRLIKPWVWSIVCLGAFGLIGGMGIGAFLWLTSLPPLPDCRQISRLSADIERLHCVREAAQSGNADQLIAGIKLVQGWSSNHPLYAEAQELMREWSAQLLAIAHSTAEQGRLERAVEIAKEIPQDSATYAEAEAAIASWQAEWKQGEAIYATAQEALKRQRWNEAAAQVPALGRLTNPYWRREKASELTQQVLSERTARERLQQALVLAATDKPDQLGQAIALVRTVNPKTYAWAEAKNSLNEWSQLLLTAGLQQWQQGDLAAAIALVHHVPLDLEMEPEARDLVRFSQAHKLATQNLNPYEPSINEIWSLMEAIAALRQIEPTSSLYALAQGKTADWQAQIEDLTQLQYAHWTASLGQRSAYQVAIGQAQQIATERPKRVRAQTLIAHWQQQMQRIEDQPYLLLARAKAEPGTIAALQQAIAAAQQVPMGRALRRDAELAIAQWSQQIQVIEDKPLLDRAQTLAQQGKLSQAIVAAGNIQAGRALYDQAQTAIATWKAEIRQTQIAEDRRILNEATSLAAETRLTLAIETAAQIGSGRPLYGEARAAIAQWESERAAIWESWAEAPQDDASYPSESYSAEDDGDYAE